MSVVFSSSCFAELRRAQPPVLKNTTQNRERERERGRGREFIINFLLLVAVRLWSTTVLCGLFLGVVSGPKGSEIHYTMTQDKGLFADGSTQPSTVIYNAAVKCRANIDSTDLPGSEPRPFRSGTQCKVTLSSQCC